MIERTWARITTAEMESVQVQVRRSARPIGHQPVPRTGGQPALRQLAAP